MLMARKLTKVPKVTVPKNNKPKVTNKKKTKKLPSSQEALQPGARGDTTNSSFPGYRGQ